MTLSTIERVLFLKSAELFALIPGEDLLAVAAVAEEVSFSAGATFIRQNDLGDCLYVVVNGEAGIDIRGIGRVATRGPQSVIGELSIISLRPRSADCVALSDVTALRIDHESFWELLAEKPQLAQGVIQVLARRLDEAVKNLSRLKEQREPAHDYLGDGKFLQGERGG